MNVVRLASFCRAGSRSPLVLGSIIVVAAALAYFRGIAAPFIFDDQRSIIENPTIRSLSQIGTVLSPPHDGSTVGGRPLLNLSLAINFALGGANPAGYRATNIALHALCGLVLFALARRILRSLAVHPPPALDDGRQQAFFIALVWTLHPLNSEAVLCVVQRGEILMACFYLATLYLLSRAADRPQSRRWPILTVIACLCGMASKEVMVSAPLMAFLFDRTFLAGSFRAAWRARRKLYVGLAAGWLVLAYVMFEGAGKRGGSAGFGLGIAWHNYALKQLEAIVTYFRLALWPQPLVFDYGMDVVSHPVAVWPQGVLLLVLGAGTVVGLWKRPALGFAGVFVFATLAPSSSIVPVITQTMAEHRMYLPLAAFVAWWVVATGVGIGRHGRILHGATALAFGVLVACRTADYRSELRLWNDTVAKRPGNVRAHVALGNAWFRHPNGIERAIEEYRAGLRVNPNDADAHCNLGSVLSSVPGQTAAAIYHLEAALRLRPVFPEAHIDLGKVLLSIPERRSDAIAHFQAGLQQRAYYLSAHYVADAHFGLGTAFQSRPETQAEAVQHFKAGLALNAGNAIAHYNLANVLENVAGGLDEAVAHYQAAIQIAPALTQAYYNLGNLLFRRLGRTGEAIAAFEAALEKNPEFTDARHNLGLAYFQAGRASDAANAFEQVVRAQPGDAGARNNYAAVLVQMGEREKARQQLEAVLRLDPGNEQAQALLGRLNSSQR